MDEEENLPEAGVLTTDQEVDDFLPPLVGAADMEVGPAAPGGQGGGGVEDLRTVPGFRPASASESGRRRRQAPVTFRLDQQVNLSPGDPVLEATSRRAQYAVADADRAIHNIEAEGLMQQANVSRQAADVLRHQIAAEEQIQAQQRAESRDTLQRLTQLNQSVMDQRINPASFFTDNRGAGLSAAASVALGVLGQGLNPNIGNAAMTIIDRAIERDIAAQVANLDNQRAGVAMARNLYGDLLNTFQNEAVARQALRGMYLSEMERRIQALTAQSASQVTRARGERIITDLRRQQAEAAAQAARERSRIVYREVTQGAQNIGSTRGIRSAAAQMQASSPLMATGMAQALQQHGQLPEGQQAQGASQARIAPGLPTAREQIMAQDVRRPAREESRRVRAQNRGVRERNRQSEQAAASEAASVGRRAGTGDSPTLSRRDARRMYRNTRNYFGSQVPNLQQVQTPHGIVPGLFTGVSSRHRSGVGADTQVFRPAMSNGRMIAVSSNGSSRFVRPGDTLRSNERLAGSLWIQESSPASAEMSQYVNQTSAPRVVATVGNSNWIIPPAALRQLPQQFVRDQIPKVQMAQQAIQAANQAISMLRRLENNSVAINSAESQGAMGAVLMEVQGLMADMSRLGVLQQGEREAIRDMTSLPAGSENWVLLTTDYDRANAALRTLRGRFIAAQRRLPISSYLRRTPSGRDVARRHGAQ